MLGKKRVSRDYRDKIKSREEIRECIGDFPRKKRVVMCHGTFDIVHPGHLRHLLYAHEKGDILVASLTCDAHVSKANYRPFVPEELRALNLAAFEFVDYVMVDQNPTPIDTIGFLKPDLFAKGFEYGADGIHPKTVEEIEVLRSYGGEILFTPGDIVYSSSALIENAPPNLALEKLQILMESEHVTFNDLREALGKLKDTSVHVVGDTIVDSYTQCTLIGGMTKTPTPSIRYDSQVDFSGGAAIVAKHLRKTGAEVHFSTVLGDDELKNFVLSDLEKAGVHCHAIVDPSRPTTNKNVYIAKGYYLLKVDKVDNRAISEKELETLQETISSQKTDAVVFSDFRHGIFSKATIPQLIDSIPEGAFRVADSQVASRWGNILEFKDFDLLTPNEKEARFALGDQDSVVRPLALDLYRKARCKYLILKLGERGIMTYRESVDDPRAFFTVETFADHVIDAVGAGDALLSYTTLAMLTTKSEVIASILGTFAAAVVCEQEGNRPVDPEQVLEKINSVEKALSYS